MTRLERAQKKLDSYTADDELNDFSLLHIYPGKLTSEVSGGVSNGKWFTIHGYNTTTAQKRLITTCVDTILYDNVNISITQVWADGSTVLAFSPNIKLRMQPGMSAWFVPAT